MAEINSSRHTLQCGWPRRSHLGLPFYLNKAFFAWSYKVFVGRFFRLGGGVIITCIKWGKGKGMTWLWWDVFLSFPKWRHVLPSILGSTGALGSSGFGIRYRKCETPFKKAFHILSYLQTLSQLHSKVLLIWSTSGYLVKWLNTFRVQYEKESGWLCNDV